MSEGSVSRLVLVPVAVLALGSPGLQAQDADRVTVESLAPLRARNIGPAGMSGRVAAVAAVESDPTTIFVGAATGGVWRSTDGGLTWTPIFDEERVQGIGAVAIFQASPDVVWVGTGEGNPRNSAGVGYGVYRSLDGGESWTHLGLEESERLHRIVLHPEDPDIAWVAALGPAWRDGGQRGVYKTTDGGGTWERVLWANERTGAADLIMDPTNPNKLFAALWEYRRWPWFFESGGPGSGLFVTHDGGRSWSEVTEEEGMPPGELGRIGLAIARSSPDVVYALVEAERSEILRSDDGGRTFRTISDRAGVAPRPFYYADLRVDPRNENRLYSLHGRVQVSEDQGRTFETVVPSAIVHGDVHELWIDPGDSRRLIVGNDGGIAFSYDRGETWRFVENLPLAQFYKISVDLEVPYNVYGGLQDNGSWYGPSTVWEDRGIMNAHWRRVGGGDGFETLNDFSDPRYGYTMSQQGNLRRFDKRTGERRDIQPVHPDGVELRFNWNAALALDPHDSTTIYLGSQFVHRSRDNGDSWELISGDLTTNDPGKQRQGMSGGLTLDATGAENHTTIVSIAPSPREPGVLWVGTDDGNVQITRDGGGSWSNVVGGIGGVPDSTWVPHIEASRHAPGRAWAVFDDHRRGNWETYLYRTDDYGRSWRRIDTSDVFGFAHVVEEDPLAPNLLFLGTEFGLHVTLDGGASWLGWLHGLPRAPVRDLVVHPRDHDLVVGTHGRGIWILDDVGPLRELALEPGRASEPLHLFTPPPAQQHEVAERIGYRSTGMTMFFGDMRPYGALISYWVGDGAAGESEATVEITDGAGEVASTIQGSARRGLNRVEWGLRGPPLVEGDFFGSGGPEVVPGEYRVSVTVGSHTVEGGLTVLQDPRSPYSLADRRAKLAALKEVASWIGVSGEARERVQAGVRGVAVVLRSLPDDADSLRADGERLQESLRALNEELFTGPECQGTCGRGGARASAVSSSYGTLASSGAAPSPNDRLLMAQGRVALEDIVKRVNDFFAGPVAEFRGALDEAGFTLFPEEEPLSVPDP